MELDHLGDSVKKLRLSKGLVLREVSERTGYSVSYLSQIERGSANPSVSVLHNITNAMGESISILFQHPAEDMPYNGIADAFQIFGSELGPGQSLPNRLVAVVRANERKGLVLPDRTYEQQLLCPDVKHKLEVLFTRMPPGSKTGRYCHEGEECGVVLKGTLWAHVGDREFTLNAGDSIYLISSVPHEFETVGDETVETIWVITPPSW